MDREEMKKCSKCKNLKPYSDFFKMKRSKDGLQFWCNECKNSQWDLDYLKYKERIKLYHREYRQKNKEKLTKQKNKRTSERDNGLYSKYWSMLARCYSKSHTNFRYYGGKGIKVEWPSYPAFRGDMHESYFIHLKRYGKKNTTLDRIDSNGNYCKKNCRWATWVIQNRNIRNSMR